MITFRTPLIQIPRPTAADDVRRCWVANALSTVDPSTFEVPGKLFPGIGLEAGSVETRRAFEELLGPGSWSLDVPYHTYRDDSGRLRTEGISTCAMTALGLGRRVRVDCEDWLDGYADDIGTGLNVAIAYAKLCGAWQTPRPGLRPGPSAIVQVLKPMHVDVVIRQDGDDAIVAGGGQVGRKGLQACAMRRRRWEERADGCYLGGRRVDGWICPDLLGYRDGPITVPVGWEDVEV